MFKRPFNTVLARLGLVAAVLATLLILAPAASAATLTYSHAENDEDSVATFTATDQDGDAIAWSLKEVDDYEAFTLTADGNRATLAFVDPPNFEAKADKDGNNKYEVTLVASGGEQAVTVTVTNEDEDGKVNFKGNAQPQVGKPFEATVTDPDGGTSFRRWQWSRCTSQDNPDDCTDITGATQASRTPGAVDVGSYLRATVTYTDDTYPKVKKTVSGVSVHMAEVRPTSNSAPKFPENIETIPVDENVAGAIGDPIVANDPNNDVVVYAIDKDADLNGDTAGTGNSGALFEIDNEGQLSVEDEDGLNFEGQAEIDANASVDLMVKITATDPSGAVGMATVTVQLNNVDEGPEITVTPADADVEAIEVVEMGVGTTGQLPASGVTGVITFAAGLDPEGGSITGLTLEGDDKDRFTITDGVLAFNGDADGPFRPDFEKPGDKNEDNKYEVTVVAGVTGGFGGGAGATESGKLDVIVTVKNGEDTGEVELSQLEPQEGGSVRATPKDVDGGVTGPTWKWYRYVGLTPTVEVTSAVSLICPPTAAPLDENGAVVEGYRLIDKAVSSIYTPESYGFDHDGDEGAAELIRYCLVAEATYTDSIGPGDEMAFGISKRAVQDAKPDNTAPEFPDQDLDTSGDQSDTAMRSVDENTDAGKPIGEVVDAGDGDGDMLLYTLGGADMASFDIDRESGHLETKAKLDFETEDEYTVTVTATDPSGATDTITVTIMVNDKNEGATITAEKTYSHAENDEDSVATFTATDQDGDAIAWSLKEVDDYEAFTLTADGNRATLAFVDPPNFEAKADKDGNNKYEVTLVASGGEQAVTVTVTNEDEDGKVNFKGNAQPQVGKPFEATVTDPDGGTSFRRWQWSRCTSQDNPDDCTDITGATQASRTPGAVDVGSYLRATVTYTDDTYPKVKKTVSGVSMHMAEVRPTSNSAPKFPENIETIPVDENVAGAIGDSIVANDPDNDVVVYAIDKDADLNGDTAGTGNSGALFEIDNEGQLSVEDEDGLNFEGQAEIDANASVDLMVKITATDPSGAVGMATVTVQLNNVDEGPEITVTPADADVEAIEVVEMGVGTTGQLPASGVTGVITFAAGLDPEGGSITGLTLEGDDKDRFTITGGVLAFNGDADGPFRPDFEKPGDKNEDNKYEVTVVAGVTGGFGGGAGATESGKLDVIVTVKNGEDTGEVELSQLEPQEGGSVRATPKDVDGGVTGPTWKWYRYVGLTPTVEVTSAVSLICPPTAAPLDENGAVVEGYRLIDKAVSSIYTPESYGFDHDGDEGAAELIRYCLVAEATYTDSIGPGDEMAFGISKRAVQDAKPDNTAPEFPDQDLDTSGDQSDTAMRSVDENTDAGKPIGEVVDAGDDNGDMLLYTLGGADMASFDIDRESGQLEAKAKLDFETEDEYTVTVTATDPSGATDTITVTIMVNDKNEGATITAGVVENTPPAFDAGTATRNVDENMYAGAAVGDPVRADDPGDTVTYTISVSMYFEIDGDGQITTTMMLDHEAMSTHTVTVTATDSAGDSASIDVTINVINAHTGCDTAGNHGLVNDCEALLASKDALGGSLNWTDHSHTPMSDWDGLTISDGRVTAINLRDQNLDGTVPAALGRVSMLTSLNLKGNDLMGGIPASLNYLSNLTVLNLHSNNLSGEIPDLGMTSLQELYLNNNYDEDVTDSGLSGEAPAWLNDMADMRELWLWGNMLTGALPDLSDMTSLERLKLNGNAVSGVDAAMLPGGLRWLIIGETDMDSTAPDLSSLMSLTTLWMNENGLTGAVPVANIPASVTSLNLKGNMLSGTIPDMSSLVNLRYLRLHRNELSGDIPGTLGDLGSIERIWAYDNDLMGIAAGFANADDTLTHLELRGNSFTADTCLPGDLAMVANNDFEMAGLAACAP